MTSNPEPVRVPRAVLDGLEAVRLSGETNMLDRLAVAAIADEMGFDQAARWARENHPEYARGVFEGFVSEEEEG